VRSDLKSRDSLAADLVKPIRPEVDARVIDLIQSNVFRKADLFETREDVCRTPGRDLPDRESATYQRATRARHLRTGELLVDGRIARSSSPLDRQHG
jgi:hypothetical protein